MYLKTWTPKVCFCFDVYRDVFCTLPKFQEEEVLSFVWSVWKTLMIIPQWNILELISQRVLKQQLRTIRYWTKTISEAWKIRFDISKGKSIRLSINRMMNKRKFVMLVFLSLTKIKNLRFLGRAYFTRGNQALMIPMFNCRPLGITILITVQIPTFIKAI